MTRNLLLATVVVGAVLAGCLQVNPPPVKSSLADTFVFDGQYAWGLAEATDDHGNRTAIRTFDDPTVPRAVQQLLGRGGPQPVSAIVPNGTGGPPSIFTTTLDQVQRSDDWGRTWTVAHDFRSILYPTIQDRKLGAGTDLWRDDSGALFATLLYSDGDTDGTEFSYCVEVARSLDGGKTWETFAVAHCWVVDGMNMRSIGDLVHLHVVSGPAAAPALPGAARDGFKNNVYICYSANPGPGSIFGTGQACVASFNGGKTFAQRGLLKNPEPCAIQHAGRPAITPDGAITVGIGAQWTPMTIGLGRPNVIYEQGPCAIPPMVYVSTDNGLTWTERVNKDTKMRNVEIDPVVTYTPDGTGYLLVRAFHDQHLYLFRSKDRFVTWEGPFRVSPRDLSLTAYAAMTSGDDGRLAIAYLSTREPQDPGVWSLNVSVNTHWHLFVTTTFDANAEHPSFLTQQVTPHEDPIQVACLLPTGRSGHSQTFCRDIGSYVSLTADSEGRFIVSLTDGCNPRVGCTGDTEGGYWIKDRDASIAVQDHGEGLRAGKILPSLGLLPPPLKPRIDENGTGATT